MENSVRVLEVEPVGRKSNSEATEDAAANRVRRAMSWWLLGAGLALSTVAIGGLVSGAVWVSVHPDILQHMPWGVPTAVAAMLTTVMRFAWSLIKAAVGLPTPVSRLEFDNKAKKHCERSSGKELQRKLKTFFPSGTGPTV